MKNPFASLVHVFRMPSAEVMAVRELAEAKRELLEAQSAAEFTRSVCQYNEQRIARLQNYVKEMS